MAAQLCRPAVRLSAAARAPMSRSDAADAPCACARSAARCCGAVDRCGATALACVCVRASQRTGGMCVRCGDGVWGGGGGGAALVLVVVAAAAARLPASDTGAGMGFVQEFHPFAAEGTVYSVFQLLFGDCAFLAVSEEQEARGGFEQFPRSHFGRLSLLALGSRL